MILYTYQVTYQEMVEDEAKDIRNGVGQNQHQKLAQRASIAEVLNGLLAYD